jgi:hypothetical protein
MLKQLFCGHDWERKKNTLLESLGIVLAECKKCGKTHSIKVF